MYFVTYILYIVQYDASLTIFVQGKFSPNLLGLNIVDKLSIYENERYFTGKNFLLKDTETNNGALQWVIDFWYSYGKDPQQVVAPFI